MAAEAYVRQSLLQIPDDDGKCLLPFVVVFLCLTWLLLVDPNVWLGALFRA
jgi:hypothetical protein